MYIFNYKLFLFALSQSSKVNNKYIDMASFVFWPFIIGCNYNKSKYVTSFDINWKYFKQIFLQIFGNNHADFNLVPYIKSFPTLCFCWTKGFVVNPKRYPSCLTLPLDQTLCTNLLCLKSGRNVEALKSISVVSSDTLFSFCCSEKREPQA